MHKCVTGSVVASDTHSSVARHMCTRDTYSICILFVLRSPCSDGLHCSLGHMAALVGGSGDSSQHGYVALSKLRLYLHGALCCKRCHADLQVLHCAFHCQLPHQSTDLKLSSSVGSYALPSPLVCRLVLAAGLQLQLA